MKIGIPRALLYYYFKDLWLGFFEELGVQTIVSPETNKDIMRRGIQLSVDEGCFSSKLYVGHVDWLLKRCDMIFAPRVESMAELEEYCMRIYGTYDLVRATFPEAKLLHANIDAYRRRREATAFISIGEQLGKTPEQSTEAYKKASERFRSAKATVLENQNKLLDSDKFKVLVISHKYNSHDKMIGADVLDYFAKNNVDVLFADIVDEALATQKTRELYGTRVYWKVHSDILGGIQLYKDKVDGMVIISTFPCGPDSLLNDMIILGNKDKPILSLMVDELDASAGLITRLESFVDLLEQKKEKANA